eukprot:Nk52_evm1s2281 gene=Nk52_evmTU1s2281
MRLDKNLLPKLLSNLKPPFPKGRLTDHSSSSPIILRSVCTDPFTNLALEDFLFRLNATTQRHILLLWRNSPSIVIGRNQNVFSECLLPAMERDNVNFVRRKSGGGTVYHDLGNVNLTFFSSRAAYKKERNSRVIANAIEKAFGLHTEISCRGDVLFKGFKVSGSAYKLSSHTAYHHCTLLLDVNTERLHDYLRSEIMAEKVGLVSTKGISSVKSPVINLKDADAACIEDEKNPNHNKNEGISGDYYERFCNHAAMQYTMAIKHAQTCESITSSASSCPVSSSYDEYPGDGEEESVSIYDIDPLSEPVWTLIEEYERELRSWEWRIGQNPEYSILKETRVDLDDYYYASMGKRDGGAGKYGDQGSLPVDCDHVTVFANVQRGKCKVLKIVGDDFVYNPQVSAAEQQMDEKMRDLFSGINADLEKFIGAGRLLTPELFEELEERGRKGGDDDDDRGVYLVVKAFKDIFPDTCYVKKAPKC